MNRFGKAATGLALVSMFVASVSVAAGQSAGGAANGGKSRIVLQRNAGSGTFDVTRQTLDNGDEVCIVKTGPKNQGASTEALIAKLMQSGNCSDAPPAVREAAVSGGGNGALLAVVGVGVAAGLGAAAAGGSDSPGN